MKRFFLKTEPERFVFYTAKWNGVFLSVLAGKDDKSRRYQEREKTNDAYKRLVDCFS